MATSGTVSCKPLWSLARLSVVKTGPYPTDLGKYFLKSYGLWWESRGPVYFRNGYLLVGEAKMALNTAMCEAARDGQEAIVELCHELGATDVDEAMGYAAKRGNEGIVRFCHDELGATDVDLAMMWAAEGGHEGFVRLCHQWGATAVDTAMAFAAAGGHEGIVRVCCAELGATDLSSLNWAMAFAAGGGHEGIVRLCHDEWRATDVDRAMVCAAAGGREGIVQLCRQWGATDACQDNILTV